MRKLFLIILLFPLAARSQVIADTSIYISNEGDTIKVVNYRNTGTSNIPTTTRLKDSMAVARGLVDLKQNLLGFTPYNATNPSGYISSITGGNVTTALGYTPLATNGNGSSLTGLTKTQVGLSNVDNTSDASKPISTAEQTALNLKANLASPTFTGSVSGITATMVGLGNVNNTSDAAKPISTLTQTALDAKQATLISATNIKTINGSTVLGSGDLVVAAVAATSTSGVAVTATASGTQTITHNLGRTPTIIRIYSISSFTSSTSATPVPFSTGTWNSTGNRCLYMVINGTTTQVSQTSTVFSIIMVTSAGNQITGVIGNVTPTGFDITWSETGTHTAGNFLWEAQ